MAADILLYQAELVPIGKDQKQHLELARTIAERFNNKYSPTFAVPDGIYPKTGAKIYSLLDPKAKMGKTDDNANGTVFLLDDPDTVMRKFKRAVTDSDTTVKFSADKPGISNLLTIYSTFGGVSIAEAEKQFEGVDYATFKTRVGESVVEYFRPIRKTYSELIADKGYLESIMKAGAEKASRTAYKTIAKVYRKIGLVPPVR
jgi:tryptophanyl-tRNA synthetase